MMDDKPETFKEIGKSGAWKGTKFHHVIDQSFGATLVSLLKGTIHIRGPQIFWIIDLLPPLSEKHGLRRDWKRLKGCVFSPPSLCPVPEREGGEKTQPFNRFTSHPGFVCPHIWSISQSSPPSVCMSYVDAPKEGNISSVTDFGCGTGGYVKMISDTGIYARGFDGNPSTGAVSIENV